MNIVVGGVVVGAALSSLALSSSAFAEEERKVDFGLSGEVEYNSNVARTDAATAALRRLTLEDTIFTPSAIVDVNLPVGRQAVFLKGGVGYSFYEKNDRLNRERVDLTAGGRGRAGPCLATLQGEYARGLSQSYDPTLEANVDNILETKRVAIDVACTRSTGFGITGSASHDWGHNKLSLYETNDYERSDYQLGLTYSRPSLGVLTLFAGRQSADYPDRTPNSGYDVDTVGLAYQRQFGARIEGRVSVSYATVDQKNSLFSGGSEETTAYSGGITYRASSRLRFQADFDHSVNPTSAIGALYDLNTSYRLSAEYDLGSRITLGLAGGQAEREAQGGLVIPGVLRDSTVSNVVGTARYRQSDRLSFVLRAGRDERSANTPQYEYTNDYVGLAADLSF